MYSLSARFRQSRRVGAEGAVVYTIRSESKLRELTSSVRGDKTDVFSRNHDRIAFELRTIYCVMDDLRRGDADIDLDEAVAKSSRALSEHNPYSERINALGEKFPIDTGFVRIPRRFFRDKATSVGISSDMQLVDYIRLLCERYASEGKRIAKSFKSLATSVAQYLGNRENARISEVDEQFIFGYKGFLDTHVSQSTAGYYLRTLRSALNNAGEDGIADVKVRWSEVGATKHYIQLDNNDDKVLSRQMLRDISEMDLTDAPNLELVRDMFLFSFYGHGIELSDLALLTKECLAGSLLRYRRRQVGNEVEVMLGDKSMSIIRKYYDPASPYLLPILRNGSRTYLYDSIKTMYYKALRAVGERLNPAVKLSFSMARPTWEHHIKNINVAETLI